MNNLDLEKRKIFSFDRNFSANILQHTGHTRDRGACGLRVSGPVRREGGADGAGGRGRRDGGEGGAVARRRAGVDQFVARTFACFFVATNGFSKPFPKTSKIARFA